MPLVGIMRVEPWGEKGRRKGRSGKVKVGGERRRR